MITRHGGVLVVTVSTALLSILLSACLARSEEVARPEVGVGAEPSAVDAELLTAVDAELERLVDVGELDGVVRMLPPSGRPIDAGLAGVGPTGTIVSQRPILSTQAPTGLAEMFELMVSDPDMGSGLQRCVVVVEGNGAGASCGPANEPLAQSTGLAGASGSDDSTLYEFVGPVDMTHFIVELGEQRLAVVTREGHALLYVANGFCDDPPTIDSAWRGAEELVVTAGMSC